MPVVMTTTAIVLACTAILAVITFLIGLYDRPVITKSVLLPGILEEQQQQHPSNKKDPPDPGKNAADAEEGNVPDQTDNDKEKGNVNETKNDNTGIDVDDNNDNIWTPHEVNVCAIVATSKERRTLRLEKMLRNATLQGILALPNGEKLLADGSLAYLGHKNKLDGEDHTNQPQQLGVSFRFDKTHQAWESKKKKKKKKQSKQEQEDDPMPRWALGWLVRDDTIRFEELQELVNGDDVLLEAGLIQKAKDDKDKDNADDPHRRPRLEQMKQFVAKFKKASGLDTDELRVIRLSPADTPVLRGILPWRTPLSPAICAAIQWKRALHAFAKQTTSGSASRRPKQQQQRDNEEEEGDEEEHVPISKQGPMAMEVYVRRKKWFTSRVDFNLVLGRNETVWEDAFPGFKVGGETKAEGDGDMEQPEEPTTPAVEEA